MPGDSVKGAVVCAISLSSEALFVKNQNCLFSSDHNFSRDNRETHLRSLIKGLFCQEGTTPTSIQVSYGNPSGPHHTSKPTPHHESTRHNVMIGVTVPHTTNRPPSRTHQAMLTLPTCWCLHLVSFSRTMCAIQAAGTKLNAMRMKSTTLNESNPESRLLS